MNSAIHDEDVLVESSSSGPGTPMNPSNPDTPRSFLETETRGTPPPSRPHSSSSSAQHPQSSAYLSASQSKYTQLLAVVEDMGKDIRPTYAGSKISAERLKRSIMHARILVRECLTECDRAARS